MRRTSESAELAGLAEVAELDRLQRAIKFHPRRAGNTGASFHKTDFHPRPLSKEGHPQDAPLRLAIRRWRSLGHYPGGVGSRLHALPEVAVTPPQRPKISRRGPGYSTPATKDRSPGTRLFHPSDQRSVAGDPGYCNSLRTSCCEELAWANAEMPVWLRISYFDMSELACA